MTLLTAACAAPGAPAVQQPQDTGGAGSGGPVRIGFGASEIERSRYQPLIEAFNAANLDLVVSYSELIYYSAN
ncbi:MAG: hypothetical protein HC822_11865 [Oscillochloris sp.]|nr:hypothetical protein [Oscillochloris sp.]